VTDRLLRAREVSELLGISAGTVLDWLQDGKLPGFRLSSRAVRFRESEVMAWLEERRATHCDTQKVALAADRTEA
jgi:excisionase family DNA binding protein